jgi:hypothetical protein
MRAQTDTINQRAQIGVPVDLGGLDWFHRLCQWFKSLAAKRPAIDAVSPYGTWDRQRERFQPFRADSAADQMISQRGAAWAERIYGASV